MSDHETNSISLPEHYVSYPDGRDEKVQPLEDAEALIFDCDGTLVPYAVKMLILFQTLQHRLYSLVRPGGLDANVVGELEGHLPAFQHRHDGP